MDPLNLLREWVTAGKRPELRDEHIYFDQTKFHRKTPTAFRSHNGEGELYELDALWFYMENKQRSSHAVYIVSCSRQNITPVDVRDVTNVDRYLTSKVSDIPNVAQSDYGDTTCPAPSHSSKRRKTNHANEPGSFYNSLPPVKPQNISSFPAFNWDDYKSREKPIATRDSILLSSTPLNLTESDYQSFWKLIDNIATNAERRRTPVSVESKKQRMLKSRVLNPVIVVPPGLSSLMTISNAKAFLEEGRYVSASSLRHSEGSKQTVVNVKRQSRIDPTREAVFEIINDPVNQLKTKADWSRIVAVFALGKSWQFRRWEQPWNQPNYIFERTCGFYMHYADTPLNENVKKWRLSYLSIAKELRHLDFKVSNMFWKKVDKFLPGHQNQKIFF